MNIKPLAAKWLDSKAKQSDLRKQRVSLIKLIDARQNRLASLETVIQNEIIDLMAKVSGVDADIDNLEAKKDQACLDIIKALSPKEPPCFDWNFKGENRCIGCSYNENNKCTLDVKKYQGGDK